MQSNYLWSKAYYRKISLQAKLNPSKKDTRQFMIEDAERVVDYHMKKSELDTKYMLENDPAISIYM